jgi:hypothetical protein
MSGGTEKGGRDILIQWTSAEADSLDDEPCIIESSVGYRMRYLCPGDTLFVCSTDAAEVYLLGALKITKVVRRRPRASAYGDSLYGAFYRRPLGQKKWALRFTSGPDRLDRNSSLTWQLRSHRYLEADSTDCLRRTLKDTQDAAEIIRHFTEGERRLVESLRATRSIPLRLAARSHHGTECYCCGFDFKVFYGSSADGLCQVHHLHPLAEGERATSVEDVRVVCANCHIVLHNEDIDPGELQRRIRRRWHGWTENGNRRRRTGGR